MHDAGLGTPVMQLSLKTSEVAEAKAEAKAEAAKNMKRNKSAHDQPREE